MKTILDTDLLKKIKTIKEADENDVEITEIYTVGCKTLKDSDTFVIVPELSCLGIPRDLQPIITPYRKIILETVEMIIVEVLGCNEVSRNKLAAFATLLKELFENTDYTDTTTAEQIKTMLLEK